LAIYVIVPLYSLSSATTVHIRVAQKSKPQIFVNILANYWPIFKIFSLLQSVTNL